MKGGGTASALFLCLFGGCFCRGWRRVSDFMKRLAKKDLTSVLMEWAEHLPSELSGGQKQRIAIARAMITQPKIILADEPTGALDSKTSFEVMDIFQEVNKEGITIIIVTHEKDISERTERIIQLSDGIIERTYKPIKRSAYA